MDVEYNNWQAKMRKNYLIDWQYLFVNNSYNIDFLIKVGNYIKINKFYIKSVDVIAIKYLVKYLQKKKIIILYFKIKQLQ